MDNEILDEEIKIPEPLQIKHFWLEVFLSVLMTGFFYMILHIVLLENLLDSFMDERINNYRQWHSFYSGLFSVIHLYMCMAFVNYNACKGDFKMNLKSGFYTLLFGSGIFLLRAFTELYVIWNRVSEIGDRLFIPFYDALWNLAYWEIITIAVVVLKLLLIYPLAKWFSR